MTVTLRWPVDPGFRLVSDFGEVEHPAARPDRGEVGALIIVPRAYVDMLLADGPVVFAWGGRWSAERRKGRLFVVLEFHRDGAPAVLRFGAQESWTWELHPAEWAPHDGVDERQPMYVGRWPD